MTKWSAILVLVCTCTLAGCASSPRHPALDAEKVRQFASRGYDPGIDYATAQSKLWLNVTDDCCEVSIVQPRREGQ